MVINVRMVRETISSRYCRHSMMILNLLNYLNVPETTAVFRLESRGMKDLIKRLQMTRRKQTTSRNGNDKQNVTGLLQSGMV